jgi:3-deoxy-7-phosphoheptulonate synthase
MVESFIEDGRQEMVEGGELVYGQSVTDPCMGWEMTLPVMHDLAAAVRARRGARREQSNGR